MTTPSRTPKWLAGLSLAWLAAMGSGFFALGAYQSRPGGPGSPSGTWPGAAGLPLDRDRPTLLMFLHPRCPCSRASVAELASVAARCGPRFAAHAILYQPERPSEGWDGSELGGLDGASIPGLRIWGDPGGRLSRRFGVETSGHVLLFDPSGGLLFSGGITASRGHRGGNPGLDALTSRIEGGATAGSGRSPIFGCPFFGLDTPGRAESSR